VDWEGRAVKPHEWRWAIRDAPLDASAKVVAWALDSRMNGAGECWPSRQQLVDDTGLTARAVDAAVNRLELAGFVEVKRGNGRGHPNRYKLKNPAANPAVAAGFKGRNPAADAGEVEKKKKEVRAHARGEEQLPTDPVVLALLHRLAGHTTLSLL
jgi:DNA-binding transcriptional MocR family regulator